MCERSVIIQFRELFTIVKYVMSFCTFSHLWPPNPTQIPNTTLIRGQPWELVTQVTMGGSLPTYYPLVGISLRFTSYSVPGISDPCHDPVVPEPNVIYNINIRKRVNQPEGTSIATSSPLGSPLLL